MNRTMKHFLLFAAACAFAVSGSAQCRTFTKKNCMTTLDGYVTNDNYNSAILIPGDEAELMLTFLGGRDYRVNVCAHPVLGKVKFDIFDTRGKLLFSSDHANGKNYVDLGQPTPWARPFSKDGIARWVGFLTAELKSIGLKERYTLNHSLGPMGPLPGHTPAGPRKLPPMTPVASLVGISHAQRS